MQRDPASLRRTAAVTSFAKLSLLFRPREARALARCWRRMQVPGVLHGSTLPGSRTVCPARKCGSFGWATPGAAHQRPALISSRGAPAESRSPCSSTAGQSVPNQRVRHCVLTVLFFTTGTIVVLRSLAKQTAQFAFLLTRGCSRFVGFSDRCQECRSFCNQLG